MNQWGAKITKVLRRGSKGDTLKAKAPEVDAKKLKVKKKQKVCLTQRLNWVI